MVLEIHLHNSKVIYERIRTVEVDQENLVYHRESYYPGQALVINLKNIDKIFIFAGNERREIEI